MEAASASLQTVLLELLSNSHTDKRLGRGETYLAEAVAHQFPADKQPTRRQIMSAVWSLVSQGLAYIDFGQAAPENWEVLLTESGLSAVRDKETNPDNAGEYLARLRQRVPQASETVMIYAKESVFSYTNRCYLASAVMLGVASEAAFLEMAQSFGTWVPPAEGTKFLEMVNSTRINYLTKFAEFRRRIETHKASLPNDLGDGMSLRNDSVLDLLRIYRNDAGHPTGKEITREDAFINLQMFARYLEKLYSLKAFFESNQNSAQMP